MKCREKDFKYNKVNGNYLFLYNLLEFIKSWINEKNLNYFPAIFLFSLIQQTDS